MKKIFLLVFLIYSVKSFALSFDELKGCFHTIDVNGQTPSKGPIDWRNQSLYEDLGNRTYQHTSDRRPLDIEVLTIYTGYNDPNYGYNPLVIFPELGRLKQSTDSLVYEVDTDVYMQTSGTWEKVDHYLKLELKKYDEKIFGRAQYISKYRNAKRALNFILKKENCL